MTNKTYWIWYPADFELYHAMKQNFSRVERGVGWPAFWKSEGFRNRVVFRRTYLLKKETEFIVYSKARGFVLVGEKKYPFGKTILCNPGRIEISVHAGCIESFPSIYIEGKEIFSDAGWLVEDYDQSPIPAGYSKYFTKKEQDPTEWEYCEEIYEPVSEEEINGGLLVEFETELTATVEIDQKETKCSVQTVYCGESKEEALDLIHCYYSWKPDKETGRCPRCAVRYVYLPGVRMGEAKVRAIHQYIDIPVRAGFQCDDFLLNRIWAVAEHTFKLCSGIFFIDGIKRDKWIWSGDAYQSLFINQYLMADEDISRRTLLALRGNEHMTTHINTIVDYSLLWILAVQEHYKAYGDISFIQQIWIKMKSLMKFCGKQTDENGFLIGRPGDWIYIDWAELDKEGPFCAEQMLYAKCLKTMAEMSLLCNEEKLAKEYAQQYRKLCRKIDEFYWDAAKHAYIDSFVSGKHHVTRHANIFAILFDIADERRQTEIVRYVLFNQKIPQITTPYFKFYELEAMCQKGYLQEVMSVIRSYWGGMIEKGAVTFWEEYNPEVSKEEQYDMYGDRFGKSLCHAWGATPIYLLARYFVGLHIIDSEEGKYELKPHLEYFRNLNCVFPIGSKQLCIKWENQKLTSELKEQ